MIRVGASIVCACTLIVFFGCGGDGDGGGGPTKTAASLTAEGWALFELGQYENAIDKFDEALTLDAAYADAYNGLGWSNAKLDQLAESISSFNQCISHGMTTADPYAGEAAVYRDYDDRFSDAISAANTAFSKDRRYVFSHDTSFDWKDLMLILAHSHFGNEDYETANAWVDSIPGGQPQTPGSIDTGDLAAEIERLGGLYGG
jgi:tetratricopeptide (TPR) repeat protein